MARVVAGTLCLLFIASSGCSRSDHAPAVRQESKGILVVDGNSWTQSRHGAVAVPEKAWKQMDSPGNLRVIDEAESGIGMAEMLAAKHQQRVDSHITSGQVNLLLLWEGAHDLVEGHDADDTARRLREYYQRRKAAGYTVIALTLLPCRADDWPSDYEPRRDTVNRLILESPAEYGDYLIDVTDLTDASLYSPLDHVHLTDAGSQEVANRLASLLHRLLEQHQ